MVDYEIWVVFSICLLILLSGQIFRRANCQISSTCSASRTYVDGRNFSRLDSNVQHFLDYITIHIINIYFLHIINPNPKGQEKFLSSIDSKISKIENDPINPITSHFSNSLDQYVPRLFLWSTVQRLLRAMRPIPTSNFKYNPTSQI